MKQVLFQLLTLSLLAAAQQLPDSKGTDFWFCFMPNFHNGGINNQAAAERDSVFIFVAADEPTTVTLRYTPYDNRLPQELTYRIVNPQNMLIIRMSFYGVELVGINGGTFTVPVASRHTQRPVPYSFHLTTDRDVTVYAMSHAEKTSDAFLVLPTDALGKDYYVMSFNADPYDGRGQTPSQFAIVATEDSTVVEFLRVTAPTTDGTLSRVVYLDRGEVYLVQSQANSNANDLTGTRIKANRPIAVFGGHQRARVPIDGRTSGASRDCLIEQLPPINTWGRSALMVPYPDPPDEEHIGPDLYRILAARDSTVIYLDSVPLVTLNAGQFYQASLTAPHSVHANRPILVAHYRRTSTPGGQLVELYRLGDPFMMLIPPAEQFQTSYRFICPRIYEDTLNGVRLVELYKYHFVTIVIPDTAVSSLILDGRPVRQPSFPIPKSSYRYLQIQLSAGVHTVSASVPFGIYVYGYGFADSYGYIGGMSFRRYDFDPPRLSSLPQCPPYRLVVYDTLPGDSRVDVVQVIEDSTENVAWQIQRWTLLPEDSVVVALSLIDPYQDGVITLRAHDAEQFITSARISIPGMTLRITGSDGMLTRPPATFSYRSATARSSCFPIALVNTGKFAQTVLRLGSAHGTISSDALPVNIVPGDSFRVDVCYRVTQTGIIHDTLWFEMPCGRFVAATFDVEFIIDSLPPTVQRVDRPCPPLHDITVSERGYTETGIADIRVLDSNNVLITITASSVEGMLSSQMQHIKVAHRDWRYDGRYSIAVTDSVGNTSLISGTFVGHTVMIVGSSLQGSVPDSLSVEYHYTAKSNEFFCDTVELYNYGLYPHTFERLVRRGVEFSVPPSYVPLVLMPGQRVRVPLCVLTPSYTHGTSNRSDDTLELSIGCYRRALPVTISSLHSSYTAPSSCDVTVQAGTAVGDTTTMVVPHGSIEYNGSTVRIQWDATVRATVRLFSASGQCFRYIQHEGEAVQLDISDLPAGVYWLLAQTKDNILRTPILWMGQ